MRGTLIGLTEQVTVSGLRGSRAAVARIDTGATRSSIDRALARMVGSGPVVKRSIVKSAHGSSVRNVVRLEVRIAGRRFSASFGIADRSNLRYKVLIGRNVLRKGFLIDTSRS